MNLRLTGKVVLITGSSRGIGLATARAFAAEGCRLMLSARSGDALRVAETALRADGATVMSEVADVTQPDDAARLVLAAVAAFGGIDILINNVGGGGGGRQIADSTDDEWRDVLERNLVQTVRMMRLALPQCVGAAVPRWSMCRRFPAGRRSLSAPAVWRGQGGADLRHRALGAGICGAWRAG